MFEAVTARLKCEALECTQRPEGMNDPNACLALAKAVGAKFVSPEEMAHYNRCSVSAIVSSCYDHITDEVCIHPKQMTSPVHTARVVFHELGHWTGPRLKRDTALAIRASRGIRDVNYCREELVAEMTSAFVLSFFGVDAGTVHADYLRMFLEKMMEPNDTKEMVVERELTAAADRAEVAARYLLKGVDNSV